jgi:hypothetical protein
MERAALSRVDQETGRLARPDLFPAASVVRRAFSEHSIPLMIPDS